MTSFKQYLSITETGKQASGRIGGALRGGFVQNGYFYAIGGGGSIFSDRVENVKEFHYVPYRE